MTIVHSAVTAAVPTHDGSQFGLMLALLCCRWSARAC